MTYLDRFFLLDFLGFFGDLSTSEYSLLHDPDVFFRDFFLDFLSISLNRSCVDHGSDMSLIIVVLHFNYKTFYGLNTLLL
jgi:hypothetical protein